MNLFKASAQWSNRPDDEKFKSLADLHSAVSGYRAEAREATRAYRDLRVAPHNGEPVLLGPQGSPAKFTHWAFGQLSARVGAPASYLRALPAALASECLNTGLATVTADHSSEERGIEAKLMFHQNGGLLVRAFTSPRYTRIWNADITSRLIRLSDQSPEWQPAPAAFDGSRGLYASDHDLFAFMVDNDRRIFERANGGLARGFFVWNSEVGASSFGVMTFYYEYVCGNHIVWGASGVQELRIRHIGDADDRAFHELSFELRKYADSSASEDEARIESAQTKSLGATKDEVLDAVFKLRVPVLSRKRIEEAYDRAELHSDWYGSPRSVWGMVNGITEVARDLPYADERVNLDRAAGKVLQIAF
jgi:hypothetical protein